MVALVVDKKNSGINIDLISNKIFKKLINLDFKEHNYIKKFKITFTINR